MAEETRIVIDLTLLLLISGFFSLVFAKIKMPPILGYLTAGIVLGPTMFPELWVDANTVGLLSSVGIVLLMFYIGLETDVLNLKKTGWKLIFIVSLQMPLMVAVGYLTGITLGMSFVQSIFLGAIICGTSTAVVVGVLKGSEHIDDETVKTIIMITIFEDVGQVIIMTMAAPLLAGDSPALGSTIYMIVGLVLFIGLSILLGMAVVPRIIDHIGKHFSAEILLIISVGLCFAMASISMELGLSIAIGAFIMGMMISISAYRNEVAHKVEPVKELFMAVFFISIGLQISPALIIHNIGLAIIIAIVFIASKIGSVYLGCVLVNMTAKKSFLIATSLVAMGEFAFIIAKLALDAGIVTQDFYSAVIGAALITMVAMPLLTKAQPRIYETVSVHIPNSMRIALSGIDHIHLTVSNRMQSSSTYGKEMRKSISLIFVDCLLIISLMLVFSMFGEMQQQFQDTAMSLDLLPQDLLLLLLILVLSPAIHNIHTHVKKIATSLTSMVMDSPRYAKSSPKHIYNVFSNLGHTTVFIVLLVLIVPFIPEYTMFGPTGFTIMVVSTVIILYLAWGTINHSKKGIHPIAVSESEMEGSCKPQ
jgi:monovalent cation:H+ antiporter-2, CPA2 family